MLVQDEGMSQCMFDMDFRVSIFSCVSNVCVVKQLILWLTAGGQLILLLRCLMCFFASCAEEGLEWAGQDWKQPVLRYEKH